MKKILFVINSMGGGGAEKVALDMLNHLDKSKYDITLLTLTPGGIYEAQLAEHIHKKSLVKVKNKFLKKVLQYLFLFIIPAALTHKFFINNRYDVEIAYLEGFPTKLIASRKSKAKKYAWVHTDLLKYSNSLKIYGSQEKAVKYYNVFEKILCVSSGVRESFVKKFGMGEKTFVQFNVLNDKKIKELANCNPDSTFTKEYFTLISVGRFVEQKGFDRLLTVCKRLIDDDEKFQLVLVGNGPDEPCLKKLAESYSISHRVKFIDFQSNPYRFIKNSDLFVCSSYVEGFSTVASEAIILGKPVLSTDCAGMHDLLGKNEYGIIVENSEDGLYQGLKEILNNSALFDQCRSLAQKRSSFFSLSKRIEEIEALLDS